MFFQISSKHFLISTLISSVVLSSGCAQAATSTLSRDTEGRPATEVLVNDQGPYKFVVDTAAQTYAVGAKLIEELDLQPHPEETAQLHGAAGITEVPLFPLDSVTVGGTRFEGILAPTLSHAVDTDAYGIVGMSSFQGNRISLDQDAMTLEVSESSADIPSGMSSVPVDFIYGTFARIQIKIDGKPATAVVDTGARRSIANLKAMEVLGLTKETLDSNTQAEGVTGHEVEITSGHDAIISIGDTTLGAIPLEFSDLSVFQSLQMGDGPAIILGDDALILLSRFAIDFGEAQFLFEE